MRFTSQASSDGLFVDRARRFVTECGFAVVAVDAPSHGDRADHAEFTRIATEYEARLDAGMGLAPLIVSRCAWAHDSARGLAGPVYPTCSGP